MYNLLLKRITVAALVASPAMVQSFAPLGVPGSMDRNVAVAGFDSTPVAGTHQLKRPFAMPLHVSSSMLPECDEEVATATTSEAQVAAIEMSAEARLSSAQPQETVAPQKQAPTTTAAAAARPKPHPKKPVHGKQGILSPIVVAVKTIMGNDHDRFNKFRAKVIGLHSNLIEDFVVNKSETALGQAVLKQLFEQADEDHNGSLEEGELKALLQGFGFDWLKEKQVHGIFQRADRNSDGHLELDEWLAEAPRTLRTNLIKLAKKNGGELGLLV